MKKWKLKNHRIVILGLLSISLVACHNKVEKSALAENIGIGFVMNPNCIDSQGQAVDSPAGTVFFEESSKPAVQIEVGQFNPGTTTCVAANQRRILDTTDISEHSRNAFPVAASTRLNAKNIQDLANQNVPCLVVTAYDAAFGPQAVIGTTTVKINATTKALDQNPIRFSLLTHKTPTVEALGDGNFRLTCPSS